MSLETLHYMPENKPPIAPVNKIEKPMAPDQEEGFEVKKSVQSEKERGGLGLESEPVGNLKTPPEAEPPTPLEESPQKVKQPAESEGKVGEMGKEIVDVMLTPEDKTTVESLSSEGKSFFERIKSPIKEVAQNLGNIWEIWKNRRLAERVSKKIDEMKRDKQNLEQDLQRKRKRSEDNRQKLENDFKKLEIAQKHLDVTADLESARHKIDQEILDSREYEGYAQVDIDNLERAITNLQMEKDAFDGKVRKAKDQLANRLEAKIQANNALISKLEVRKNEILQKIDQERKDIADRLEAQMQANNDSLVKLEIKKNEIAQQINQEDATIREEEIPISDIKAELAQTQSQTVRESFAIHLREFENKRKIYLARRAELDKVLSKITDDIATLKDQNTELVGQQSAVDKAPRPKLNTELDKVAAEILVLHNKNAEWKKQQDIILEVKVVEPAPTATEPEAATVPQSESTQIAQDVAQQKDALAKKYQDLSARSFGDSGYESDKSKQAPVEVGGVDQTESAIEPTVLVASEAEVEPTVEKTHEDIFLSEFKKGILTNLDVINEKDLKIKINKIAYYLSDARIKYNEGQGFVIKEIDDKYGKFTDASAQEYAKWDYIRAEEIAKTMVSAVDTGNPPAAVGPAPETGGGEVKKESVEEEKDYEIISSGKPKGGDILTIRVVADNHGEKLPEYSGLYQLKYDSKDGEVTLFDPKGGLKDLFLMSTMKRFGDLKVGSKSLNFITIPHYFSKVKAGLGRKGDLRCEIYLEQIKRPVAKEPGETISPVSKAKIETATSSGSEEVPKSGVGVESEQIDAKKKEEKESEDSVEVTNEEIQAEMGNFIKDSYVLEQVDRKPKDGDILIVDVEAKFTGGGKENVPDVSRDGYQVKYFENGKEFAFTDPATKEEVIKMPRRIISAIGKLNPGKSTEYLFWPGGREASYRFTLRSVNESKPLSMADLNNDFVRGVVKYNGVAVSDLEGLKLAIKRKLAKQKMGE